VGSLIGLSCATIAYCIYWPNPFSPRTAASGETSQARFVYGDADDRPSAEDFELAEVHDEDATLFNDDELEAQGRQALRR
jgi:hypothetical protein